MSETITIDYQITKNNLTFNDAIILPVDHGLTDDEIAVIKQQRFDKWYKIVTDPVSYMDQEQVQE